MNKTFRLLKGVEQQISKDLKQVIKNISSATVYPPGWNETILNFYNQKAILPVGQCKEQLAGWLAKSHPRYNMTSWCFFGNITNDKGVTAAISSIVQEQLMPDDQPPCIAEWSYCDDQTNGYVVAPFILENPDNVEYSVPFAITVDANPIYSGIISLSLTSGLMGEPGATYRMAGRVITTPDTPDQWEYELLMTDTFGSIQVGYGPSSFLPQWLTNAQQQAISNNFSGSVDAYLQSTNDDMKGQGSYYFSIPLMQVNNFTITKNGQSYFNGTKGNVWIDYVVQSFNSNCWPILAGATWEFFAIQFPEINGYYNYQAAIMVSIVTVEGSNTLAMAHFYYNDFYHSKHNPNGSRHSACDWPMNNIQLEILERWNGYPTKFKLTLKDQEGRITSIEGKAIRDNQLVKYVKKYEGVYNIMAQISIKDFDAKDVVGFAWAEVH